MNTRLIVLYTMVLMLLVSSGTASAQFFLNPYAPMNAVAAEPNTPYNLDLLPKDSRVTYTVCPTCVTDSLLLPDVPPPRAPFPGPSGMPVSLH